MSAESLLIIRPARLDDLDRIAALEQSGFPDPWPADLLAYELRHPGAILLVAAWGEGPAVGYAAFRHGGGEAELLRLSVDPAERRRGLGQALVNRGLERLREIGVESCFLEVRLDNEGAIACYRSLGFTLTGMRRAYYRDGSDALVYSRRI
ncbi:MAG TPA: ribosomal protein S18-alanine N-acetyltransferase [Thermoanaerobaculia bacterium]|nr:ribosomal protein S18-alanine N-acetyltransferase [Thermoanaerobaculia bacterium]